MGLKMLIFDLDGTLLDTLQDLAGASNSVLAEYGLPPLPADEYKNLVGMGVRILMQRISARSAAILAATVEPTVSLADVRTEAIQSAVQPGSLPDPDEMVAAFNRIYKDCWAVETKPYEGIPTLLENLAEAGLILTVLSNKPDEFTQKVMAHYFPDGPFQIIFGMRSDFPGKPDPTLAWEICRLTSALPEETALIGDSGSDMQTAVAAGVLPVGVLWGFRSEEELTADGARLLARTPEDLLHKLRKLIG